MEQIEKELEIKPGDKVIDCTYGEGGHTAMFLRKGAQVLAFDADPTQLEKISTRKLPNLEVCRSNFRNLADEALKRKFVPVRAVLFDLGLSMAQLANGKRGLSYHKDDEYLDMRIDPGQDTTAADILNIFTETELYGIFSKYSEDLSSGKISKEIVRERSKEKIETVGQLKSVIRNVIGGEPENSYRRIFQALRIAVNDEKTSIAEGLQGAVSILEAGGKIAVITFHSGEDRWVKEFVVRNNLKSKMIKPGRNAASFERPAKLRIITKNE